MSPTDGALYKSVILPSLLENGRAGVRANTPGLHQSIAYMKILEKVTHSDFEKNAKCTLPCFDKSFKESSNTWLQFYHLFMEAS